MVRSLVTVLVAVCWLGRVDAARSQNATPPTRPVVNFDAQVLPILRDRCVSCHGPVAPKSGFRVDQRASLLSGGDSGEPGVVPGDSEHSSLVRAVSGQDPDLKMPPKGGPLRPEQVQLLRDWVEQGAAMPETFAAGPAAPELWSLKPLKTVSPPTAAGDWAANPIDAFIFDRLRRAGLSPSPPADPGTTVRRASLDVLGLPPSPEAADRTPADESAYARMIDDLLGRPQYGERWAQHWLDVIRWAENWGYETNMERPDAWPFRDWVVRAFNDDLPFDRFLFAQIAGDTTGDDAATGLLVAGPANLPGQIGKDEPSRRQARQDELDEVVKTVSAAFLGLTVGCARCHNHKFDPITQRDYYAVQAIFAGLRYGPRRLHGPENGRWTAEAHESKAALDRLRAGAASRGASLGLKPPVTPERQTETFPAVLARALKMEVHATSNGSRPSLFELEAWGKPEGGPPVNVARKGKATASSFALENQTRHPDNLIDGLFSDADRFPWTAAKPGPAWVQVDFDGPVAVDRIVWQRGDDGFPADYDIALQKPDGTWVRVAHPRDRMLHETDRRGADEVRLDGQPAGVVAELAGLVSQIRSADAAYQKLAAGPQVFAGTFRDAEPMYRLHRGDPMQRRETVAPDVPGVLGKLRVEGDTEPDRRVAFARWLSRPDHPLTARVIVNRLWQHHFGTGLVDTPSDFGRMGSAPSHPELLDWLAGELVRNGWSLKHVHRLILTSATYRQSSAPRPEAIAVDADCRLLWRFPPRRLEAEAIRDSILSASGALDPKMGGAGFDFFNQKGGLSDYIPRDGDDPASWRRMIYATKVRMKPVDVFGAFDCPDAGQMAPRRARSITPVQALGLLNSRFVNRQAELFAETVKTEAGPSPRGQVNRAFARALGRRPSDAESSVLVGLAERHGLTQVCRVLFNANEFVFLP